MSCAAKPRVFPDIAVQVDMINAREVVEKVFSHPIERRLIDEVVVCDEAHNPVTTLQPICCPPEELHIRIIELVLQCGMRSFDICLPDPAIDYLVLSVLVIVILIDLP